MTNRLRLAHGRFVKSKNRKTIRTDSALPGIYIADNNPDGLVVSGLANGLPSVIAMEAGYFAVGCTLVDTTNGKTWANFGSVAVPDWNSISDITLSEISLAEGKVLVGDAAGKAVAQNLSGDITVSSNGTTNLTRAVVNVTPNNYLPLYASHGNATDDDSKNEWLHVYTTTIGAFAPLDTVWINAWNESGPSDPTVCTVRAISITPLVK